MKLFQTSLTDNFTSTIQSWISDIQKSNAAVFHVYVPYNHEEIRNKLDMVRDMVL